MADATGSITPLEGVTTLDQGVVFEPSRLSYESARDIAAAIADRVAADVSGQTVVVASSRFAADLTNLVALDAQLTALARDYEDAAAAARPKEEVSIKPSFLDSVAFMAAAPAAITGVKLAAESAIGLLSLFRQDVSFTGAKTEVDTLAVGFAFAERLVANGAGKVIVPDLLGDFTPVEVTDGRRIAILAQIEAVQQARARAWKSAGPLLAELARLETELESAGETEPASKSPQLGRELARQVSERRRTLEPVTNLLGRAEAQLTSLQAEWQKFDERTGVAVLARLLRTESIRSENPLYLYVDVVQAGGHHRITRSLWRTIFVGDGVSACGGVVLRWALVKDGGTFVCGDVTSAQRVNESFARVSTDPTIATASTEAEIRRGRGQTEV